MGVATITTNLPPRTLADLLPAPTTRRGVLVRDVLLVVGFAALTALAAQLRLTLGFTPVPVTGQTMVVLLAGVALGWQRGAASMGVYWAAGIFLPVPWYSGDTVGMSITDGWAVATGATAGYLAGFIVAAAAVGHLAERGQDRNLATSIPAMLAGTALIYVMGVAWLAHHLGIPVANGDPNAIALGLTPFLLGDAIKLLLAGLAAPLAWRLARRRS